MKITFHFVVFFFAFLGLLVQAGCMNSEVKKVAQSEPGNPPYWIYKNVKTGLVCFQQRGILSVSKAEQMAINSCILQKAAKRISGHSKVNKTVQVTRVNGKENIVIKAHTENDFIVETANGSTKIDFTVKSKYYDAVTQTVYVWIE